MNKLDMNDSMTICKDAASGDGERKNKRAEEDNTSTDGELTSWAASEDQLTDFIIDKDEQGVGEGAEPPVGPGKHTRGVMRHQRPEQGRPQAVETHLRGYIRRATSMPGQ